MIDTIKRYCEHNNISVLALARAARVSQSALARFLVGNRKTVTHTARKCCSYMNSQHNWHNEHSFKARHSTIDKHSRGLIEEAAKTLWDGDPNTEELVAAIIKTLKPTVDVTLAAIRMKDPIGDSHDH